MTTRKFHLSIAEGGSLKGPSRLGASRETTIQGAKSAIGGLGGEMIPGYGSTKLREDSVASAATIQVKSDLVRITGTTQVDNILSPLMLSSQGGLLIFVYTNGAGVTLSAAGNIAVSQALVTNRLYAYIWSKLAGKWIPHGVV